MADDRDIWMQQIKANRIESFMVGCIVLSLVCLYVMHFGHRLQTTALEVRIEACERTHDGAGR